MTESDDRIVRAICDAKVLGMGLEHRARWMNAELARRFGPDEAQKTTATLERADALFGRLVIRDFETRIEALERLVRELPEHR